MTKLGEVPVQSMLYVISVKCDKIFYFDVTSIFNIDSPVIQLQEMQVGVLHDETQEEQSGRANNCRCKKGQKIVPTRQRIVPKGQRLLPKGQRILLKGEES